MTSPTDFEDFVLGRAAEVDTADPPRIRYDHDGDYIEVIITRENYRAERIDELVTVYTGRTSNEIVGTMIKGVLTFIAKNAPGLRVVVDDGKVRVDHLLVLRASQANWDFDSMPARVYRKLIEVAERVPAVRLEPALT